MHSFCLIFFLLSGIISLYILYVNALCNIWLANVFLPFCRFVHCFVYFAVQEFFGEIVWSLFSNECLHQGIFRELSVDLSAEHLRVLAPSLENPYHFSKNLTIKRIQHLTKVVQFPWRRKWQPTPVFLPGESQGWGEPGGLLSMESHRVGHDWSDLAAVQFQG